MIESRCWLILIPMMLTLGNLGSGLLALALIGSNETVGFPGLICMLVLMGGCLDGLDGPVARKLGVVTRLGLWLDTIADFVTFGLVPVVGLLFEVTFSNAIWHGAAMFSGMIYLIAIAWRLWRHVFKSRLTPGQYIGLPSPAAGIVVVFVLWLIGPGAAGVCMLILSVAMIHDSIWTLPHKFTRLGARTTMS